MGEKLSTGLDLVRYTCEREDLIRKRLLMAQSRRKSYADRRKRPLEFEVGDHVFLKLMPKRGVVKLTRGESYRRGILGPSRYSRGWVQSHIDWSYR